MGYDTQSIFILFGVKIPQEDVSKITEHFFPGKQVYRALNISGTTYHFVNHDDCYISLISPRFKIGEDDHPEPSYEIIPPTQDQVDTFIEFLEEHDIYLPYTQFLLC